ncbi:MAG TPA: hypothetical protein DCE44_16770 [Verrucomicrobiales bacterium]|nr:hypothetical protein [Verrucomicrobiales bacterium]
MPSKLKIPWLALALVAVGLLTWGLDVVYTLRWNPELQFFKQAYQLKVKWAERLTREKRDKVLIYGGSSSLFSIDTGRLFERANIPAVNFAFAAGIGASVLTQAAVEQVRPGDTLIVALEPVLLTDSLEPPGMGVQFSFITGHTRWFARPTVGTNSVPWVSALLALRPGGYHTLTMLGKVIRGGSLYRYEAADLHPDGFTQTDVRVPDYQPGWHSGRLPPGSRAFLQALREWCTANQVQVYYLLPWSYSTPEVTAEFRRLNARLLGEISAYIPVLADPRLGAYEVKEHFADSGFHLNLEGAAIRTDELAELLKSRRVWTEAELRALAGP